MVFKTVLSAALVLGLGTGAAIAQTAPDSTTDVTRNPVLGDPGTRHAPRVKQTTSRAKAIARSDKQPPGTTNGNQPDRAATGAGAGGGG